MPAGRLNAKLGKRHLSQADTRTSPLSAARSAATSSLVPSASSTRTPGERAPVLEGPSQVAAQWARIRGRLQSEVGEVEYRSWFKQMTLGSVDGDEVTVHLPSRFLRDWVRSNYGEKITVLWQQENPAIRRVDIRLGAGIENSISTPLAASAPPPRGGPAMPPALRTTVGQSGPAILLGDLSAPLDQSFNFENFVVGKPNEFAYACARRVAEKPGSKEFNPLFLYGGVGLGKTHLMHAIGVEMMRAGSHTTVAYMSAEKFMYRFIAALRSQKTIEFKDLLRSVDVLMIDDLQFLIGKDNTQEEFFHTFNALVDAGKQIVVSADKSPSDLSGLEDRLRTRLGCGMVADLHATTYELRISILEAKAARAATVVPAAVLEFLARSIASNVRELEGALNRLIAHAGLFDEAITMETAQQLLRDILNNPKNNKVTIAEIQRRVAEHYNMRLTDMTSSRRARAVARPRQVAMFLAKQLTGSSLPEIGKKFGNRDHTTVMHACARVTELMVGDSALTEDVELLRKLLEG